MSSDRTAAAAGLARARRAYRRDMNWIRERFGIIPEAALHQVGPLAAGALDALEAGTPEALAAAVRAFEDYHRAVMRETVWKMLEQSKNTLAALHGDDAELYAEKTALWNRASWLFTNFSARRSRTVGGNYRKALKILAEL